MKNFTFILMLLTCFTLEGWSQLNYSFTTNNSSSNFNLLSGGTTVFDNSDDNEISGNLPIGFSFVYECNNYTQFQLCTEGWIGFGGGLSESSTNNLTSSTRLPLVAPLWDQIRIARNVGNVRYRTTGTSPNRVLTVQWFQMRWDQGAGNNNNGTISFQVKLYETTNVIEFHYMAGSQNEDDGSASIGLSGSNVGDFYSVNESHSVSTTSETSNIDDRPGNNRMYRFTPSSPSCSGTPTAGTLNSSTNSVSCAGGNVNFSVSGSSSGCGISYQWQSSPNGSTWSNIAGANSSNYSQFVSSTTYFRRRVTCSNGGSTSTSNSVVVTYSGCTGTPSPGSLNASTNTTSCASANVNFTVSGGASGCDISYIWQYSDDNINFTDLMGQNSSNMNVGVFTTGYYRRMTTCLVNGISSYTNSVLVTNSGSGQPNDLPCYSVMLTLGVPSTGSNVCSNSEFEPGKPGCWTNGNRNTVWYSFVAPASGQAKIKTIIPSTINVLQRTQIALYGGPCSNLNYISCDVNAPSCGSYVPRNSEITANGLTPGVTYYVAVDGESNDVGDFAILVVDGAGDFPVVQGQDCSTAFTLCNPTTTIGNPGYQAIGGRCDHTGSGNCTGGEANSVWYTINIKPVLFPATQQLIFDIVPNDYGLTNPITGQPNPGFGGNGNETDYDFVLYKISGSGAVSCASIATGANSVACNYSPLGVTGLSSNGNAPAAYPGFNGSYETGVTVSAGESYILVIQNYSNSTAGFTVQLPANSPAIYTPPTTVYWTGGNFSNNYTHVDNWGGCNAPSCGVSAFVTASSTNQPVLTPGTYSVENLTINAGATLTIQSGATLEICGNFSNNGTLICETGSNVIFNGVGTQTLSGAFENSDSFFNFTVTKLLGSVVLTSNIDVDGNFLTSNNTSVVNTGGNRVRVGGNFTNANGNNTFTNIGTTGTLGFIGTGARNYTQGASQLDLNIVTMNKTSGGTVSLNSNLFIKANTGSLTLLGGKFITGNNRVDVLNNSTNAVSTGNVNSYVVGNLYRAINSIGSYDFPVGTSMLFERANITFTTPTTINTLRSRFDSWPSGPNTLGLVDCGGTGNFILPAQNMGYWTITASNSPTSGTYDVTLYSTGATNTVGATGWTVQKASNIGATWGLDGNCAFSTASVVQRTGLNGFSVFGIGQSTTPLPIELSDFSGYRYKDVNVLKWTTVSELNSDHFLVEKSRNGTDFFIMEKINAQGNSSAPKTYSTVDDEPYSGITYYRLNFYDTDGSNEFSKTIAISGEITKDLTVRSIFPNPGNVELNMDYSVSSTTEVFLSLVDASGRPVKSETITVKGNGTYTMKTDGIAEGIYLFVVTDNDGFKEVHSWVKR